MLEQQEKTEAVAKDDVGQTLKVTAELADLLILNDETDQYWRRI